MSYQVLARKYRPQTFEEVVGQEPIVTTLQNAVAQNRIHHAYLFSGLRGVGKTTVARLLAKSLNCGEGPTPKPCNRCSSCSEIAQSRSMDVMEIDGASNRGIDDVRGLRETVRYAPSRDRYKVYIIDEVHMLTEPAWNALLKTLEEPPPHVVFVFATTEYRKIPLTILSRCQHFEFRKIADREMATHLGRVADGEEVSVPGTVIDLIARIAEGSLRDAQSALDQVIAFSGAAVTEDLARTILGVIDRELVTGFYDAVQERDCARLVGIISTVFDKGYLPVQFLEDLMAHGRDLLLAKALPDPSKHLPGLAGEVEATVARAAAWGEDDLLRILELLTREEGRLKNTGHPRFLLEALAIKMARLSDLRPVEELIARIEGGSGADRPEEPGPPRPNALRPNPIRSDPPRPGPPRPDPRRADPSRAHPATPAAADTGAADTGAADTGAASSSGVALVETILRRVHDGRAALGGFLGQASWVEIVDGELRIAFLEKQTFFREKVETRESLEYLRQVAREAAGRDLPVKVVTASPAPIDTRDVTPADAEASRKRRLRDEALREPILQTILDTFGGEVLDVDKA